MPGTNLNHKWKSVRALYPSATARCRKCKKVVSAKTKVVGPKRSLVFECCGKSQSLDSLKKGPSSKLVREKINKIFPDLVEHYTDDGEIEYEGLPNE